MAPLLKRGDTLLLEGPIGAGKTHFARALIQAQLGCDEPVPSPSYTLVQTYAGTPHEIWHADLYRLSDPSEIAELGLDDAMVEAICLVEWPDRGEAKWPDTALWMTFALGRGDTERDLTLRGQSDHWSVRLDAALKAADVTHHA